MAAESTDSLVGPRADVTVDLRELAERQNLLREVNERINALGWDEQTGEPAGFVCECSRADCWQSLELSRSAYEAVRASPIRFALIPGHQFEQVERVVEDNQAYLVVENIGKAAEIAELADPRTDRSRSERRHAAPASASRTDPETFRVTSESGRGAHVISLVGECDLHNRPQVHGELAAAVAGPEPRIVVDLTQASFIDSSFVGTLVEAWQSLGKTGREIVIVCPDRQMLKIFEITGLGAKFRLHGSLDEALARGTEKAVAMT